MSASMEWEDLDLVHGRPSERGYWYSNELGGRRYKNTNHNLAEVGWRREHAARVWSAIQAVLLVGTLIDHITPRVEEAHLMSGAGLYYRRLIKLLPVGRVRK